MLLEFTFTERKANTFIKILNHMLNGNVKTIFGMFVNYNKIMATAVFKRRSLLEESGHLFN